MGFLKDKEEGEFAEDLVLDILKFKFPKNSYKKAEGKNEFYDIVGKTDNTYIEVKFDKMSLATGNMCFEYSNGVKETGIWRSQATHIWYVAPTSKSGVYEIYVFDRLKLIGWLTENKEKVVVKNGGDKKKFILMLVKLQDIKTIGDYFKWAEHQE